VAGELLHRRVTGTKRLGAGRGDLGSRPTVIQGLQLPHLSEYDPDLLGEGSLDPLGLAPIADRLAEEIAPGVRARMFRIRFLTAIAVCSSATQFIQDAPARDNVSTPYLAFEWHFVQALAYFPRLPALATFRVPGTEKAKAVESRNANLDALSYLKTPKVFGFHGVYKPLAGSMGVVDRNLMLAERGDELVRAWEREEGLTGFADRTPKTPGGNLARKIEELVLRALTAGGVSVRRAKRAHIWSALVNGLRPDQLSVSERRHLSRWLRDDSEPHRAELVDRVYGVRSCRAPEAELLRELRPSATSALGDRLDAIDAYEKAVALLGLCFDALRRLSTEIGLNPVRPTHANEHRMITHAARKLGPAMLEAHDRLAPFGLGQSFLEAGLDRFIQSHKPSDLVAELLDHHERNQAQKPPGGKRSWFDPVPGGVIVRSQHRLDHDPALTDHYLHPYRIDALRYFCRELAGETL
jgi:hypothetical protein